MAAMPVEEDEHGLTGGMMAGKGLKYGPAQEFGAEIDASNGHMLAIPMEDALTPAGVARFAPRDAKDAGYDRIFFSNVGNNVYMFGVMDGIVHCFSFSCITSQSRRVRLRVLLLTLTGHGLKRD